MFARGYKEKFVEKVKGEKVKIILKA